MFTSNKKTHEITLKAISKNSKTNPLVILEAGAATLISEEKTMYLCLEETKCIEDLKNNIEGFISTTKYKLNIDIDSFLDLYEEKEKAFQAVVETILFASHKQIEMKVKNSEEKSFDLIFDTKFQTIFDESVVKMEFVNFARDLQDLPPNIGTSVEIAKKIEEKAKTVDGVKVIILDKKQIEKLEMGLFLGVNAGSNIEPRLVVLEYVGDPKAKRTALVGKGITFDTGGYNLKPSNFLENMKFDMSGAAIVSATLMALAKRKAKCNVISIGLLTDNRIGAAATLTESIIKSMNGKTVEITNTDAEGRLVLADGITYAVRNEKAERVVTVATLTGAIDIALGKWFTGAFSTSNEFYAEFEKASSNGQESIWRLPVIPAHLKAMSCSKIADLVNSEPGRQAGSSTAAAFLDSFAEGKQFIHLDIASTGDQGKRGRAPMVRAMFELLK